MASGVKVADRVKDIYNEMKVVKSDADNNERMRVVVLAIIDNCIDVEKIFLEKDLAGQDIFKFFKGLLEPDKCRYILYDCHFETKESSKKEELVFTTWCPESGRIKDKMSYASSKEALMKVLQGGVKHNLQMNDISDCGDRDCFAAKLSQGILCLEGHSLHT
uniref:non-muscle cofilin 1-like n=1 Tax=Scatophagus argus TaxID=75038 RepID=UPI001ED81D81|nr:non-muscle cofilin 1-like [Scatophagus argus]